MKRKLMTGLLVIIIISVAMVANALPIVDHISVLTGAVMKNGLVVPGQMVAQGDVLVMVNTIAGPAPAARANVNGRVVEVLVKDGDIIRVGQIVVRIEPQ